MAIVPTVAEEDAKRPHREQILDASAPQRVDAGIIPDVGPVAAAVTQQHQQGMPTMS
jgi:hypothetical protein